MERRGVRRWLEHWVTWMPSEPATECPMAQGGATPDATEVALAG
jgi:hypothetical protein